MIVAIVLAAGLSTRMGALKQLLPLGECGKTVIEVVVERVLSCVDEVIVVLGHQAEHISQRLSGSGAVCVVNDDYEDGMISSVRCGIRSAVPALGYLICLGDQPAVEEEIVATVVGEARSSRAGGIVIPTYDGKRGHPVFIHRKYADEILNLDRDAGLNAVTRGHSEDTVEIPVNDRGVLEDMDTPEDYDRTLSRFNSRESRDAL